MRVATIVLTLILLSGCSGAGGGAGPGSPIAPSSTTKTSGSPIDVGALRGRIAFSDETNDVWTMRADGSHVRRLTHGPAQEFDPTWSPDGSRIAYRHWPHNGTSRIFEMKADGSDQRNLTRKDVWGADWSPDGRRIVFNGLGTCGFGHDCGYVVAPDGSGPRRISRHYVEYPAWSPDGTKIAFMAPEPGASGSNPDYNIFVMNADGTDVRRLTDAPGEDGWPAWSPDGQHIVFSSARDDCSISPTKDCRSTGDIGPWEDAWNMNADGTDQHRLTKEFAQFFAWSPDGDVILVAGGKSLFVIRPDGTGATPIEVPEVAHPLFPDWIA